jgi:hypothetical protein
MSQPENKRNLAPPRKLLRGLNKEFPDSGQPGNYPEMFKIEAINVCGMDGLPFS